MQRVSDNTTQVLKRRDLSDIVGTWIEDDGFDAAIADQRRIEEEMWNPAEGKCGDSSSSARDQNDK
jgi:hypothetical protein